MLSHRLDKEVALVLASAVDGKPSGQATDAASSHVAGAAAAAGTGATVDHTQKVSQDEARRLTASIRRSGNRLQRLQTRERSRRRYQ